MNKAMTWMTLLLLLLSPGRGRGATVTVGPWEPLFQGVELAAGRQDSGGTSAPDQEARCLRVDLAAPGVSLFATPPCDGCGLDTLSENTSHFLEQYGLQVAVNGAFYGRSGSPADTPVGTPDNVRGVAISQGIVVSVADSRSAATLLFTADRRAFYVPYNQPPTNTAGIETAVSGDRPLLVNGVNVQSPTPSDLDPRTALGLSADRRYLYLLTIDGRQSGWSDGADFHATGEWLRRFGAADGINVDGGGSTTMVMQDCLGSPVRLNRPSYVAAYGRERVVGHNFGVRAAPLAGNLRNLVVDPGVTTAVLTWETSDAATTRVDYGLTEEYGSTAPDDGRRTRRHGVTLAGLEPGTTYFYRVTSTSEAGSETRACRFDTRGAGRTTLLFDLTHVWSYTTNNLDDVAWTQPGYPETGWQGSGPGLLCVENSSTVGPKNTALPPGHGNPIPRTYYFRTHFTFPSDPAGTSLLLSNYVDDGAVYHLNGAEVHRLRMPEAPEVIRNDTLASGFACAGTAGSGDANRECPDVFPLSAAAVARLVPGDNVLAAEVHNYAAGSPDLVFGAALYATVPEVEPPRLQVWVEDGLSTLLWNGSGFVLQRAAALGGEPAAWEDVPGLVTRSPAVIAASATTFYRLRQVP